VLSAWEPPSVFVFIDLSQYNHLQDEVRPVTDWWSQGGRFRSSAIEENQTEEEQDVREQQDFEEIQKSYAELESTYTKFLSDSGLSSVGYCRVGVHLLQEDI
jgi:hypothetical protein